MLETSLIAMVILCIAAQLYLKWQVRRTYVILRKEAKARNIHNIFQNEIKHLKKLYPAGIDKPLLYKAFYQAEKLGKEHGIYREKQLNNIVSFKTRS